MATDVDDGERDYSGVKCYFCNEMGHIASHCPKKKKNQVDKKAREIAATTATTATDNTSTIGTKPTSVNVDPVMGEKLFSTIVQEDEDLGEFNLATVASHEKVLAGRGDPVPEKWIILD